MQDFNGQSWLRVVERIAATEAHPPDDDKPAGTERTLQVFFRGGVKQGR